jgi:hypothetical protein
MTARGAHHSAPTPPRPTPTGMGSPGVHRGADGLEYFGDFRLVEPLDRIVLRLLSKAPDLRYAAAGELVLDLRDFLNRAA